MRFCKACSSQIFVHSSSAGGDGNKRSSDTPGHDLQEYSKEAKLPKSESTNNFLMHNGADNHLWSHASETPTPQQPQGPTGSSEAPDGRFPYMEISPGSFLSYIPQGVQKHIMPEEKIEHLFQVLKDETDLEFSQFYFMGHKRPRTELYIDDEYSTPYKYSGKILPPFVKWGDPKIPPELELLRTHIQQMFRKKFDSVLINKYRDGQNSVDWHSDASPAYTKQNADDDVCIVSVSLGCTRKFNVKVMSQKGDKTALEAEGIPLPEKTKYSYDLGNGDILVMSGRMQKHWVHQVPKLKPSETCGVRINLTFRTTVAYL
tara:strand:+ start:891 stop:1841 length:951 start_codon:yes stop_codon:yes gene_type:complete